MDYNCEHCQEEKHEIKTQKAGMEVDVLTR